MVVFIALLLLVFLIYNIKKLMKMCSDNIEYWDGPEQTEEEKKASSRRMTDLMIQYPGMIHIEEAYPEEAQTARAVRRYFSLLESLEDGLISQESFDRQMDEGLPLLTIKDIFEK
jgi:Na+-transporting methylmalonyl-CoA/oxaloacetate decarboxylase gamma subunit